MIRAFGCLNILMSNFSFRASTISHSFIDIQKVGAVSFNNWNLIGIEMIGYLYFLNFVSSRKIFLTNFYIRQSNFNEIAQLIFISIVGSLNIKDFFFKDIYFDYSAAFLITIPEKAREIIEIKLESIFIHSTR